MILFYFLSIRLERKTVTGSAFPNLQNNMLLIMERQDVQDHHAVLICVNQHTVLVFLPDYISNEPEPKGPLLNQQ